MKPFFFWNLYPCIFQKEPKPKVPKVPKPKVPKTPKPKVPKIPKPKVPRVPKPKVPKEPKPKAVRKNATSKVKSENNALPKHENLEEIDANSFPINDVSLFEITLIFLKKIFNNLTLNDYAKKNIFIL